MVFDFVGHRVIKFSLDLQHTKTLPVIVTQVGKYIELSFFIIKHQAFIKLRILSLAIAKR